MHIEKELYFCLAAGNGTNINFHQSRSQLSMGTYAIGSKIDFGRDVVEIHISPSKKMKSLSFAVDMENSIFVFGQT